MLLGKRKCKNANMLNIPEMIGRCLAFNIFAILVLETQCS